LERAQIEKFETETKKNKENFNKKPKQRQNNFELVAS